MNPQELRRQVIQRGFEQVLNDAKVPQRTHLKVIEALTKRITALDEDAKGHAEQDKLHGQILARHETQSQAHERQIAEWDAKVQDFLAKDWTGVPGKDADPGKPGQDAVVDYPAIIDMIRPLIPVPKDGDPGKDATVDEDRIVSQLISRLQKEKPLDISHIRNAQTFIKDGVKYKVEELMRGAGGSSGSGSFTYNEVVSGSGTAWTLVAAPINNSLRLFANGQRLTPTIDYSLSGSSITTVDSWTAGTILADYQYA